MYSTDKDRPPKRPIVGTLTGALTEIQRWLAENRLEILRDGDGLDWRLAVVVDQVPAAADPKGLAWRIRLKLTAEVTPAELVATGALDGTKDARLIELVGEDRLTLTMKPLIYTAPHEEAARLLVAEEVPKLRRSLAMSSLAGVKRQLVGRFIDERGRFGALGG